MEKHKTTHDLQQQTGLSKWKTRWGLWEIWFIPVFLVLLLPRVTLTPNPPSPVRGREPSLGGTEQFFILEKTELFPHFCLVLLGLCELKLAQVFHLEKEDNDPDLSRGAHSRTGRAAQSSIWVL